MLMVPRRRSCDDAKQETVADGAKAATLIKSLMRPQHKHHQKDNKAVALLSGSNERQYLFDVTLYSFTLFPQRWKLVAPCLLPAHISCGNYLGTGEQLDIDEFPADSPLVILLPIDQREEKMIDPAATNSLSCSSFSGGKCIGHTRNRNKRSKTVKGFSHRLSNNCVFPDKPLDLLCNNSTQEDPENLAVSTSKASETVKANSKKKAKKKGRHHRKKPPQNKDLVSKGAACETSFHVFPGIETSHIAMHESSMVPDNTSARPVCASNSDGMEDSEPQASSFDESACSGSIFDQPSPYEDSYQASLSKGMEDSGVSPSPVDEDSINANGSKASSACDSFSGYFSGQDKFPVSVSPPDEWTSDMSRDPGEIGVENTSNCQDQNDLQASEHQMLVGSSGCMSGSPISDWCDKNVANNDDVDSGVMCQLKVHNSMPNVADGSSNLNENKSCDIPGPCQSSVPKRRRHGRESCPSSSSSRRFGGQNTQGKMKRDTGHPVWQRVQSKGVERRTQKQHGPNSPSDSDAVRELDGRGRNDVKQLGPKFVSDSSVVKEPDGRGSRNDAILLHQLSDKKTSSGHLSSDKKASYSDDHRSDNRTGLPNRIDSEFEKVAHVTDKELANPDSVLKGKETESTRMGAGNGKIKNFRHPKTPFLEHNVTNKSPSVGSQEQQNLSKKDIPKTVCVGSSKGGPPNSQRARRSSFSRAMLPSVPQRSFKGGNNETLYSRTEPSSSISSSSVHISSFESQSDKTTDNLPRNENRGTCYTASSGTQPDMTSETTASYIDSCNNDHLSVSPRQKWVPVGKKDSHIVSSCPYEIESNKEDPGSSEENVTEKPDNFSSESNHNVVLLAREEDDMEGSLTEKSLHKSEERNGALVTTDGSSTSKESMPFISTLDADLEKIMQAVADAHGLQSASEVVHLQTGGPLAEFEKVLHSASPVVCQTHTLSGCRSCSQDRMLGNSLCRHQIPNMSLRNLWQWYEKQGSYGLEVQVEDQNMNKLDSRSKFRAYFVPYLSAVQLFGQSKHSIPACSSICEDLGNISLESDDQENSSGREKLSKCISRLTTSPIFSILLPQPHQDAPGEILEHSLSSAEVEKNSLPPNSEEDDQSLLFEYFESDPPQQRPPLFDKIKMLVRGDRSLNSQTFGDPSYLECLHLHDVHPASWFSVAWYPIYRIPDGNLRAAFLTYHCLGNFIRRSYAAKHDHATNIVSPAVGLQSYNSRGECWFQLDECKSNSIKAETPSTDPSQILKERLRTLNQTAAAMARASVRKHGQKSPNAQPDYEFFSSRAW